MRKYIISAKLVRKLKTTFGRDLEKGLNSRYKYILELSALDIYKPPVSGNSELDVVQTVVYEFVSKVKPSQLFENPEFMNEDDLYFREGGKGVFYKLVGNRYYASNQPNSKTLFIYRLKDYHYEKPVGGVNRT